MPNRNRIFIAGQAALHLAPLGTVAPADAIVTMPAGWVEVGYFTPDSLSWATEPNFGEVQSHQSNFPTRRFQQSETGTLSCDLQEWSASNMIAVNGGGTVTNLGTSTNPRPNSFRWDPPAVGARKAVAATITVADGIRQYRFVIPAAEQVEGVEQAFQREQEARLPLRLSVLGSDVGQPYYVLVEDANWYNLA